ncbi:RNA polymerase sigma-70 factor (ECF subfamily) [Natronobacillus azotifigens]|uniref:Sigma-70 family RNA polymerase sigma factor n=1 Tax=Natronobacillus azotifigens TaxID=472978 RepID=A0A9J6REB5_9BACI|nr:sigma-70 family RNA polymerase sigma factor [Natronobacillus azotifigens]MCZ0703529.1 sigma-70 family RNA polymerase sigma factor [Natronobacillus azotifigens]
MIELVKKAQKGNEAAFITLFQNYEKDIYRIAFVYVKNQNDALDVVQETAYRSFKTIKKLKEPCFFKTWLIKIAINCSLDLLKKQRKIVQLKPTFEECIPSELDFDIDWQLTLHDLIGHLNEIEKSVIILRFYEDLTFENISNILDIPLGTAKTILYRALKKLRIDMKGDHLND